MLRSCPQRAKYRESHAHGGPRGPQRISECVPAASRFRCTPERRYIGARPGVGEVDESMTTGALTGAVDFTRAHISQAAAQGEGGLGSRTRPIAEYAEALLASKYREGASA